jgi:hypothetical protein
VAGVTQEEDMISQRLPKAQETRPGRVWPGGADHLQEGGIRGTGSGGVSNRRVYKNESA